jgi:hypothetical protein|tara:strand:+ start:346 stop:561 length:216 start_codon:yes stop_codon:yes gene_type:complete
MGLNNLYTPFDSTMTDSKIKIEKIGAKSFFPGSRNQTDPNNPKRIGVNKKITYLFLKRFIKIKHKIKRKMK